VSVQNQAVKNVYAGNGSTTVFPYTFALNEDDGEYVGVYVTNDEGTSEETDNYTIDTTAKTVTYPASGDPLEEGKKITIIRELPNEQNLNLENLGPFFADDVEDEMDREVMMIQQLAEQVSRAVKVDVTDDLPSASVVYDINHVREYKDEAALSASNAAYSESVASEAATNAAASALAASTSETNAGTSETNAASSAAAALASQNAAALSASNALTSEQHAAASEANAASSETAASVSASSAATDASTAAAAAGTVSTLYPQILTAASNAGTASTAAQAAATSAQASAATATTKEQLATAAAESAADDAADAAASATAAANSAGAAATSATEAAAANTEAKYYAKITMDKVAEAAVGFPSQEGTLTYDGTEQEPTWDIFFESQKLTVSGTLAATNAGTYSVTMTPKSTYYWWDTGTTETRTQTWTIGRASISAVPTQSGALVFDGTVQSPTWTGYDPVKMTLGGTTLATAAGTYTATFTPTANYQWSDTTTTAKNATWEIAQATVTVPTVTNTTKTYNGSAQSPTISTYDPLLIEVTGDSETDAGSYNVVFHLKSASLTWTDTTTADKTAAWSISPKSVTVPLVSGTSFTYDGTAQGPTVASYDPDEVTASGDITATNAGNYALTLSLTSITNYVWADTTTAAKVTAWTISKAAGSLSLSPTTISLNTSQLTDTIIVTRAGDGAISAVSSDTSIATVSVSGTTITVTAVANGSVTVTVSVAAGTNWLAPSDATASVAVQLIPTLNDATWAQISEAAQAGTGALYWDIGDIKMITLNGKIGDYFTATNLSLGVFILDFNHAMDGTAENNIIFGGFKTAVTDGVDVALVDSNYGDYPTSSSKTFNMNHTYQTSSSSSAGYFGTNYGGWKGCDLRYDILGATSTQPSQYNGNKSSSNVGYDATAATLTSPKADTFLAALPSDLRSNLRLWTRYVDAVGNQSNKNANILATVDAVTLLAEPEIFASVAYANSSEAYHNTRMAYYTAGNSTIKNKHSDNSTTVNWWECSPNRTNAKDFCAANVNAAASATAGALVFSLAPAFKV